MARKATVSVESLADKGIQIPAPAPRDGALDNVILSDEEVLRIREGMGEFIRDLYYLRLRNPLLVDALLGWAFRSGNVSQIAADMRIDRRNVQRLLDTLRGDDIPETLRRVIGLPPA